MDDLFSSYSVEAVSLACVLMVILAVVCLKIKEISPSLKKILFGLISGVTVLTTGFLAFSTIYLNTISSSGGPVHYHADFEVWACGKELDLVDPKGWSNKVGTSVLHEHNDKRIHQEGVILQKEDSALGNFFKVTGGEVTNNILVFSTNQGKKSFVNGQMCLDSQVGEVQVFVYQVEGQNYRQRKVQNPQNYIFSPYSQVPPGDCIIIEFDSPKDKTDKLCRSYKVAKQIGKLGEEL